MRDTSKAAAYCAYYCEENIWHLCADPRVDADDRRVLFISNRARKVAMWGQKIAKQPSFPIAWDYHVVLFARARGLPWQTWDLDTRGACPQPARTWLLDSFSGIALLPPEFEPHFRLVDAQAYRRHFRSDRRHMRRQDGSSRQPPPSWPPIQGEPFGEGDDGWNLGRFLDMDDSKFLGELLDLQGMRRWLSQSQPDARA